MSRVDRFALNRADVIWARKSQTSLRGYNEPDREVTERFPHFPLVAQQQLLATAKRTSQTLTKQSKGVGSRGATAVTTGGGRWGQVAGGC